MGQSEDRIRLEGFGCLGARALKIPERPKWHLTTSGQFEKSSSNNGKRWNCQSTLIAALFDEGLLAGFIIRLGTLQPLYRIDSLPSLHYSPSDDVSTRQLVMLVREIDLPRDQGQGELDLCRHQLLDKALMRAALLRPPII